MTTSLIDSNIAGDPEQMRDFIESILASSTEYSLIGEALDGKILLWNEGARRLYGYEPEEVIGLNSSILHAPEDVSLGKPREFVLKALEDGKWEGVITRVRKNGERFTGRVVITPRRDRSGRTIGFLLISKDISAEVKAGKEFRLSEERFRLLADKVQGYAIFFLDASGLVTSWNAGAERMQGYKSEEIIGKYVSVLHTREDVEAGKPEKMIQLAAAEGRAEEHGWRVRKDGTQFWMNAVITALRDADGRLIGFSNIVRDLTERKGAEDKIKLLNEGLQNRNNELMAANKELEAFTYSVSHDLRAPLRHIDGFARLLVEEHSAELSEPAREYLTLICDSSREMGQLVDDLLHFTRVGRTELTLQSTSLNALVDEVLVKLKSESAGRKCFWNVHPLPSAECDPSLIKQVFTNLLSNALKFTRKREPAVIEVGSMAEGDQPVFFVRDNGVGFNMKHVDKLFGVFQRLHRQEDFEGTGVGLALVQRIIHKHGGRIWAEAKLNKGATFYFTLGKPERLEGETGTGGDEVAYGT